MGYASGVTKKEKGCLLAGKRRKPGYHDGNLGGGKKNREDVGFLAA